MEGAVLGGELEEAGGRAGDAGGEGGGGGTAV